MLLKSNLMIEFNKQYFFQKKESEPTIRCDNEFYIFCKLFLITLKTLLINDLSSYVYK